MKIFILILLVFLSSLGCASKTFTSPLEERARYADRIEPQMSLGGKGNVAYVPTRVPEKVIVAWLHAKELTSTDYFWGSWVSIVLAPESWTIKKVESDGQYKRKPRTSERPSQSRPKKKL